MIEYILDFIRNKSDNSKISVIFRHPKREKVGDWSNSFNTPLVEEGRKMAIDFGKRLSPKFSYNIYHSKYHRCVEAAELILQGIQESKPETKSKISGASDFLSFFYVLDVDYIAKIGKEIGGGKEFFLKWQNHELDPTKIIPFRTTTKLMVQKIAELIDEENKDEIELLVTHDWVLVLMLSKILDIYDDDFPWPQYFESIFIKKTENRLKINYKEYSGDIVLSQK